MQCYKRTTGLLLHHMCHTDVHGCCLLASLQYQLQEPVQEHSSPCGCSSPSCWDGSAPLQHILDPLMLAAASIQLLVR